MENSNRVDLESKFNYVMLNMIKYITKYYGDKDMKKIYKIIEKFIDNAPDEPIAYFLIYIYNIDEYRINILMNNDDFYLGKITAKIDFPIYAKEKYSKFITKLFEFKDLWPKIDNNARKYIKKSMKCLVSISSHYVMLLTS